MGITPEMPAAGVQRDELQRRMRDLLAFAGLFSLWPGRDALGVAETYAAAAASTLDLDLFCLRVHLAPGSTVSHVIRGADRSAHGSLQQMAEALQPWLDMETLAPGTSILDPMSGAEVRVSRARMGLGGEDGVILAGSRRPGFPNDFERLLLSLGANQVSAALKERRLMAESEERFRARADTAPVMLWTAGPDRLFDWFNQPWLDFTGSTLVQQVGQGWMDGVHPDDHERWLAAYLDAVEHRRAFEEEFRLRRQDGAFRSIVCRGVPRREPDGSLAGYIGSAVDITERKAAEQEMRNFVSLVGQSADFIGMTSMDGRVLFLNPAGRALVGLEGEGDIGLADLVHGEDEAVGRRVLASTGTDGQWAGEMRFRHLKTGGEIPVWCTLFVLRDDSARPICLATVARDLTAQKSVEAYLRRQDRLKDEFLATLSHELRSPLNAIVGWAHMLGNEVTPEETRRKAAATILRNANALGQIVSDVLDVSRIIAGKLVLNLAEVDLAGVLEAALDTVHPAADAGGVELCRALQPGPRGFQGDADRLQQVVWNLLLNAIKFCPRRGQVMLRLESAGAGVRIVVEDDGPGIDPQLLPHIFERFRQGNSSTTRRHGGLGLGLAIVRHLTELHGGTVEAANRREGTGAVFTVTLPVEGARASAGRQDAAVTVLPENAWGEAAPRLDGLTVLVVDDDEDARELAQMALESRGARTLSAASAAEGLRVLADLLPDVLLTDIGMPDEDGYEFLRRVRQLSPEAGGLIPAAVVTAYAGEGNRRSALRSGFHAFIAKPAHPAELVATVAQLAARAAGQAFQREPT
jgi:PAS domain S-box-containing protein